MDDQLACDDELTFQMIHQIAELHFKLVMQYLGLAERYMLDGLVEKATEQLTRVNTHLRHLPEVFNMVKVISPIDYHTIRLALGRGSGQDSPGFNQILQTGPSLWGPFEQLLQKHDLKPLELHKQPQANLAMFQLMRRMIGLEINSLKGVPAQALQKGVRYEFYPVLWKAISELTDWTGSSYNAKPLAE